MEISSLSSAYSNVLNAIEYSNDPAVITEAVMASEEIEDRVELSVAALEMSQKAEESIAMQLIQGLAETFSS